MLEVSILSISTYFLLVFDTVPTEWYFVVFFNNSIVVNVAYFLNNTKIYKTICCETYCSDKDEVCFSCNAHIWFLC